MNITIELNIGSIKPTSINIYGNVENNMDKSYNQKLEFNLVPHVYHNFAYYISEDLKPIEFTKFNEGSTLSDTSVLNNIQSNKKFKNNIKVSGVNNPINFPASQTYQIGDGEILSLSSQSIRTSDGQFGQYPLLVFCSDGVFSLEVGTGDIVYSKISNPQSYERPISHVTCTTPFGIVFISNRGLCLIAGQQVKYLSNTVVEKQEGINLEIPTAIESSFNAGIIGTTDNINSFIKDCTAMVYNPREQEIIIVKKGESHSYVYSFITEQFYKTTEEINDEVINSLPDIQVYSGGKIKNLTNYSIISDQKQRVMFITRPVKMQMSDFKRFERVIMRALLSGINTQDNSSPSVACLWGSSDDKNFTLLRGVILESKTRKDIDFGMLGRATYGSYIFGLSMNVKSDSRIKEIEVEFEKAYRDAKMT